MQYVLYLLNVVLPIIFITSFYKLKIFSNLKAFIFKLFWIDKFEGSSKILLLFSKAFINMYLFFIPFLLLGCIFNLVFEGIVFLVVVIFLYPLMFRQVMKLQCLIHGIK